MPTDYDPSLPDQHAQLLFDSWKDQKALPNLYGWLSARNVDANVTPHKTINEMLDADVAEAANYDVPPAAGVLALASAAVKGRGY